MNIERRHIGLLLVLFVFFLLSGCEVKEVRQLKLFKEKYNDGDYQWVAAERIDTCTGEESGCNQLYLLQGNACYKLAKSAPGNSAYLQCAADALETGIAMTTRWKMEGLDLQRAQNYENLCESLRLLTDRRTGTEALQTNQRLLIAARGFEQAAPGTAGPLFYLNKAEYRQLQPRLIQRDAAACAPLQAISEDVAKGRALAGTGHYISLFTQFEKVLNLSLRSLPGCR